MTLLKRAQLLNARLSRRFARGEGMSAWDGEEHFWPELHDFEFEGDNYDRFGSDYQGHFGEKSEQRTYRSLDDMNKILKESEGLWKRWSAR